MKQQSPIPPTNLLTVRGFSLIEILVVVSIIAVLIALILGGVAAVTGNANQWATESTFATLEAAVDEYYDLNGRYPRVNRNSDPVSWNSSQNRMTGWPEQFFDEMQKYGEIGSMLGPLLQTPPEVAGNEDILDIRDASPIADGWGFGIVPIIPHAIADDSSDEAIRSLRPWFYSSGPNGSARSIDPDKGGMDTPIVWDHLNANDAPARFTVNNFPDRIDITGTDDLYSASAP
ncbi:type II secretion system protein [Mucisphaera sp.]|uniref:type II secretion system protein n=1 Tax=Mucisphaera sp. TaxID=2913024 RepID=UPI003D0E0810